MGIRGSSMVLTKPSQLVEAYNISTGDSIENITKKIEQKLFMN